LIFLAEPKIWRFAMDSQSLGLGDRFEGLTMIPAVLAGAKNLTIPDWVEGQCEKPTATVRMLWASNAV
jgi:hypothetical protein